MDPLAPVVQGILFAIFATLTAVLQAVTGPTYEGLVVPEMDPGSLFPPISGGGPSFLSEASRFSAHLVVELVDPAIVLVVLGLGLLYLTRSFLGRDNARLEGALPRLLLYVVLSNITVPIAGAILALAGSVYPVVAGFDGGAWKSWGNLIPPGAVSFSWDNGALAFVVSFALFSIVLLLAAAVALRDAFLGVLLVLLPVFTLLGAIPTFRPLARRAWLLFGEAAFLPCVLVIPLELAVGSPSVLFLLAYFSIALGSPALLSSAGTQLTQLGFPSAGNAVSGGIQRGLGFASLGASSYARSVTEARPTGKSSRGSAWATGLGSAGRTPFPLTAPLVVGDLLGRGAGHLIRHLRKRVEPTKEGGPNRLSGPAFRRFPSVVRARPPPKA